MDADISDYFGSIQHKKLIETIEKRITDKHLLRLIGKWLRAGVMEGTKITRSDVGLHQGSIISPILANIYLHEALDIWIHHSVQPRMRGEIKLYRYADDFVVTFCNKEDADRFISVLPKRLGNFGLSLHPDKTHLIAFGRQAWNKSKWSRAKPQTFNFLGFTHYCGTTQKGKFAVKTKTMARRLRRSIARVEAWCRNNRRLPLLQQHANLSSVLRAHIAYYGRRDNSKALLQFHRRVVRIWKKWLSRRGHKGWVTWKKLEAILCKHPFPAPRLSRGSLTAGSQVTMVT